MAEKTETTRYLVADWWGHIFDERSGEVGTRFVYDRAEERIVAAQYQRDQRWHDADPASAADIEDSLKSANPQAIEKPADWDLAETDELPDWAPEPAAPGGP